MNVVVLSDHAAHGGAATAASRIASSINLSAQTNAKRVVFFPEPSNPDVCSLWYEESATKRRLLALPRRLLPGTFPRPNTLEFATQRLRRILDKLRPDIINVHNLHAAAPWGWSPYLVEVCLSFAPVVWTLHDMWSFTGRCAYSYDCEKFITGCDVSCPTPTEAPALAPELIRGAWLERLAIYEWHTSDLFIVTPSQWLAGQARRGFFAQNPMKIIPYGLPLEVNSGFTPTPREDARRELGVVADAPVLLIAAFDLTERRKGAGILPHLWPHIKHRPITILTMGTGAVAINDPSIKVQPLGFLDNARRMSLAYSAADALLHPAPVDNFPNVVLEALACGTPTIAMPVGGVPEIVRPGVSGWLADAATPAALGQAVDRALQDLADGISLRDSCRDLAEKEYDLEVQGQRYFQLFEELRRR